MPRPPNYGIIYNRDCMTVHGVTEYPQSMKTFLAKTYAPLEDTQVGAHFWCVGEHTARWKSDVLELVGDVHGRKYENAQAYTFNENVRAMLERGEDPQAAAIERGHELGMHVYASIRMNDNHFNGAQIEDLPRMHHSELTRMRIEHPEWLLGDQTSEWFALSWDFEVPEIREHRYAHVEEVCRLYDWDGVELDWQRHAFHLPDDQGYRLRYVITDLQRAIRRMTDELAEKRGRPFYLAARVSGTLQMCRRIGYDIPTWVKEGLVDILIPAGGAGTDPSIDVRAFKELCRGTDVVVYPGFDGGLPEEHVGPEDAFTKYILRTRAIADRYHKEGADGIYVFNWHSDRETRRGLLSTIGKAETLRRKSKLYAATHRILVKEGQWRGAYKNDRIWGEAPVSLKRTLTGDGPAITLDVADDVVADAPVGIELRVRLEEWVRGDVVRLLWDGIEIENPRVCYCQVDTSSGNDISNAVWLSKELGPESVSVGEHQVKVILVERNTRMACDIILTDVELVLRYNES